MRPTTSNAELQWESMIKEAKRIAIKQFLVHMYTKQLEHKYATILYDPADTDHFIDRFAMFYNELKSTYDKLDDGK